MNKEKVVLGIDTSNYTTSLALMDLSGNLVDEERMLLSVRPGSIGLRQSEALFQHIQNLPNLAENLLHRRKNYKVVAISSTIRPRPIEGSYMPVFLASQSYGKTMAHLFDLPFYEYSHQEGHIAAGLWSKGMTLNKPFLSLHISGGTTEVLKVIPQSIGYKIDIVGSSGDISAGQFIDRVGNTLGLSFPAGPSLEKLAKVWEGEIIKIPISVKGNSISFSGPETFVQRLLKGQHNKEQIAYSVFENIGRSLHSLIQNLIKEHELDALLIVGGVASNGQIKRYLTQNELHNKVSVHFGEPKYCSDNAVGISFLGVKRYLENI